MCKEPGGAALLTLNDNLLGDMCLASVRRQDHPDVSQIDTGLLCLQACAWSFEGPQVSFKSTTHGHAYTTGAGHYSA